MKAVTAEISAKDLQARLSESRRGIGKPLLLLDVRQPEEVALVSLASAAEGANITLHTIPLMELPNRIDELGPGSGSTAELIVYCRVGERSRRAVQFLLSSGFSDVRNLADGILGFARDCDPTMPTY